jgi:hypothetical protein
MSIHTRPPARPAARRWPFVAGAAAIVGVLGFGGLLVYLLGGTGTVMEALGRDNKVENAADGRIGQAVTDGSMKFTVVGMKCGATRVGDDAPAGTVSKAGTGKKAEGQYCLVEVAVTNSGSAAAAFSDLSQEGFDATGSQYAVDSAAGAYANKDQPTFLQPIAPGATVRGNLAFDVPVGRKLTAIVLHESLFSAGVKVPLR